MPPKRLQKDRGRHLGIDLSMLIQRAARRPGIAEALLLHRSYHVKLTEIHEQLRRWAKVTHATSNSTG